MAKQKIYIIKVKVQAKSADVLTRYKPVTLTVLVQDSLKKAKERALAKVNSCITKEEHVYYEVDIVSAKALGFDLAV